MPDFNVAIECQGGQHFNPIELFADEEFYSLTQERDERKSALCEKHGITAIYYSKAHIDYPYHVFEKMEDILNFLKQK